MNSSFTISSQWNIWSSNFCDGAGDSPILPILLCVFTNIKFIHIYIFRSPKFFDTKHYIDSLLCQINQRFNLPVSLESITPYTKSNEEMSYNSWKFFGVIVVVPSLLQLNDYLKIESQDAFKNSHASYVIIILESFDEKHQGILEWILKIIWRQYGILKAAIIFQGFKNVQFLKPVAFSFKINYLFQEFYYFHPFRKNSMNNITIDSYNDVSNWGQIVSENVDNSSLFCGRTNLDLYKTFNGYPLPYQILHSHPSVVSWNSFLKGFSQIKSNKEVRKFSKGLIKISCFRNLKILF